MIIIATATAFAARTRLDMGVLAETSRCQLRAVAVATVGVWCCTVVADGDEDGGGAGEDVVACATGGRADDAASGSGAYCYSGT